MNNYRLTIDSKLGSLKAEMGQGIQGKFPSIKKWFWAERRNVLAENDRPRRVLRPNCGRKGSSWRLKL